MPEAFHFIRPLWLLALLPLALLAWRLARHGGGDNPWQRTIDAPLLPLLTIGGAGRSGMGGGMVGGSMGRTMVMVAAGWTIAVLALAGPTWQKRPQPVFQTSAARVVVLDLSTSMLATDLKPSRLERARFKVEDVLALGGEGQTGLVAYAGDAFAVAPLTRDANTVSALLKALSPDIMPVQGNRADLGLLKGAELMRQAGVSSGELLLIADGVDAAHADAAAEAAARLRQEGYRVSVVGVGTEQGAPLLDAQGRLLRDAAGKPEIARLDATALQAIARAGGGAYLPISGSGDALRALLDTGSQAHADAAASKQGAAASAWVDEGPWFVLLLLPLAALAFRRNALIDAAAATAAPSPKPSPKPSSKASRERPAAVLALAGLVTLGALLVPPTPAHAAGWRDAWLRPDQQAAAAMRAGDYAKAAKLATDAERRGSAEYKLGNYASALENFSRASGPHADYNRGNALAQLGRYGDAVAAYDKALAANPNDADAKANKAAVEALLRKQQEQAQGDKPQDAKQAGEPSQGGQGGPQQGQQGQQGQQQASNTKDGSSTDKSATDGAKNTSQGNAKSQPDGTGKPDTSSASASASSAQKPEASSTSPPEPRNSDAQQAGSEPGRTAPAAQAPGQPAPKPGDTFADAAAKLATKDAAGAPKADEAVPAQTQAPSQTQAQKGTSSPATQQTAAGAQPQAKGAVPGAQPIPTEEQLAAEQWLRRIPDDPGGLLRRKFLYQYQQRANEGARAGGG
jgi:Ca-activated chloride channel family protein